MGINLYVIGLTQSVFELARSKFSHLPKQEMDAELIRPSRLVRRERKGRGGVKGTDGRERLKYVTECDIGSTSLCMVLLDSNSNSPILSVSVH